METRWLKTIIVATVFAVIFVPVAINYLCLTVFLHHLLVMGNYGWDSGARILVALLLYYPPFMFFTEIMKWSIIAKSMKFKKNILTPYVVIWENFVLLLI